MKPIRLRSPLVGVALLVALALTACGTSDGEGTTTTAAPGGDSPSVVIDGFDFDPRSIAINVGDTVTWENAQGVAHTSSSIDGNWNSGSIATGETFEHTFDSAGTFNYFCSIHPTMLGTVEVSG